MSRRSYEDPVVDGTIQYITDRPGPQEGVTVDVLIPTTDVVIAIKRTRSGWEFDL